MTRLAIVPPSLKAGKKNERPGGLSPMKRSNRTTAASSGQGRAGRDSPDRESQGKNGRFQEDAARKLRLALTPLDERNRHLADPAAGAPCMPRHLDLKGVAIRGEARERNPEQGLAAPDPEAARHVVDIEAG